MASVCGVSEVTHSLLKLQYGLNSNPLSTDHIVTILKLDEQMAYEGTDYTARTSPLNPRPHSYENN